MSSQSEAFFSYYYQKWMTELDGLLTFLLNTSRINPTLDPAAYVAAVNKLTSHHREFHATKRASVPGEALAFLKPLWLSPAETSHIWISGWRPSTAFHFLGPDRIPGLTEGQLQKIASLRAQVVLGEEGIEKKMERQWRRMGGGFANDVGRVGGSAGLVQETAAELEEVVKMADTLRWVTIKDISSNLLPVQGVKFFIEFTMFQIRTREFG